MEAPGHTGINDQLPGRLGQLLRGDDTGIVGREGQRSEARKPGVSGWQRAGGMEMAILRRQPVLSGLQGQPGLWGSQGVLVLPSVSLAHLQ
jgi:hypothetical protein